MTYEELVLASKAYADRQDLEVDQNIDLFIVMTEAKINRLLKTREQTSRSISPTVEDQEYYGLPPDYAGMRDIQLDSEIPAAGVSHSTTPMTYLMPEQFNIQRNKPYGGTLYYCVIADQIQIYPCQAAGKAIEMVYYQKVPNLNEQAPDNWLSRSYPDIYLAGMISEIELFAKHYDAGQMWAERMGVSIAELDNSDIIERWSGSPLQIKVG